MKVWGEICNHDGDVSPHQVAYLRDLAEDNPESATTFSFMPGTEWMFDAGLVDCVDNRFVLTSLGLQALVKIDEDADRELAPIVGMIP